MAQKNMTLKILSEVLKNRSIYSRCLHDGNVSKKGLHNANSVVGMVADSMGRTRSKLKISDLDKNGMTRVGPNPDILQVQTAVSEAVAGAEPKIDEKSSLVMADPNSSMWNLCKDKQRNEAATKKLTVKFKKLKDNIKQYYVDRLEENEVMFAEVNEPLTIPKMDRKEKMTRFRAAELDDLPEQMMKRSVRRQRYNQCSEEESNKDYAYAEEKQEQDVLTRGYRKFNKMDYKNKINQVEEAPARDSELRMVARMPKKSVKSLVPDAEECNSNLWKKQTMSKGDKEKTKEDRVEGSFSEIVGGMSPAVHFKTLPKVGLRRNGLLDSIKSDEMVLGFFKKRLNDSRDYSTLMNYKIRRPTVNRCLTDVFEKFKPVGLMLQRDIANHCDKTKNLVSNNLVRVHSLSTCSKYHHDKDLCRPAPLPPKICSYDNKLPKCDKAPKPPEWPCCPKICLCGCDAPNPRVYLSNCGQGVKGYLSTAKRPEYECPSFSECKRQCGLNKTKLTECCIEKKSCDNFVGDPSKLKSALERQEASLGQKYWTGQKQQTCCLHSASKALQRLQWRGFHSTNTTMEEKKPGEEECEKPAGKNQLPCQKTVNIPGVRKKDKSAVKGSCEKLCMPCCEPARDPPECMSVYQKGPCQKFKNPRPSFSECRKKFPFKHSMCECEVPKKPICDLHKKKSDKTC